MLALTIQDLVFSYPLTPRAHNVIFGCKLLCFWFVRSRSCCCFYLIWWTRSHRARKLDVSVHFSCLKMSIWNLIHRLSPPAYYIMGHNVSFLIYRAWCVDHSSHSEVMLDVKDPLLNCFSLTYSFKIGQVRMWLLYLQKRLQAWFSCIRHLCVPVSTLSLLLLANHH